MRDAKELVIFTQTYDPRNRSWLYVRCIKSDSVWVASQLNPVT